MYLVKEILHVFLIEFFMSKSRFQLISDATTMMVGSFILIPLIYILFNKLKKFIIIF